MYLLHNHTDYSNASRGFADCSHKVKDLVKRAKELGLSGIAITDHEITSSYVKAKALEQELDFPVICGNEIYLVSELQDNILRNTDIQGGYYPHFILLALDKVGVQQIWELSAKAWVGAYHKKGLIRTTTTMTDVERVIGSNKGHVVASQACLGSQISRWALDGLQNPERMEMREQQIHSFIKWCYNVFGEENFYLEIQPATKEQEEQMMVNDYILNLAKEHNYEYIFTTDSHYLKKDLLQLHNAFLNSKEGGDERETEKFYGTAYLMSENELRSYFTHWSTEDVDRGINNTIKIGNRAERYSLFHKQIIPKIEFEDGWKISPLFFPHNREYITKFLNSEHDQDRYLMYLIERGMKEKIAKEDYEKTFDRIEEELAEFWHISISIEDRMSAYFVTMNKLIDLAWNEAQAIIGTGRGSGVSSMTNFLLDITQINPLKMPVQMPFWRFINRERPELPDIDWDSPEHKRADVYNAIKDYYESIGGTVVKCATFGTIGSKSAILTAGRGLGYDADDMKAITALIPTERGFTWSLKDCYYGNEEKDRKLITEFKNLVDSYDRLFEVALMIEGLIVNRGTHASGIFLAKDFMKYNSKMISSDGTITSQYDLHDSEHLGLIKYDALTTSALSKMQLTLEMLVKDGYMGWQGSLKATYMKYLNPHTIQYDVPEIWDYIANNDVPDLFQFDTVVAVQTVTRIKPQSLVELAQANSLMRLMPQAGQEAPTDTYVRFKNNIDEWYKEMKAYGVPESDFPIMEELMLAYKGVMDTQEAIMIASQHPKVSNFTIGESNKLRKGVAKKNEKVLREVRKLFFEKGLKCGANENTLRYIWEVQIARQLAYSFSILHTIAYTFIALQELILFHYYPKVYWYTACLTVNSGSIEIDEDSEAKSKSTNYDKVAKAIGDLQQVGVEVVPPYINSAGFSFTPDVKHNRIIFSLKGINGIGDDVAQEIIKHRPYYSLQDFCAKLVDTKIIGQTKVISLIKAGCFDEIERKDRVEIMKDYIGTICEPKRKLTTSNIAYILENGLLPDELAICGRYYKFKKYIFNSSFFYMNDEVYKTKKWYRLNDISVKFMEEHFLDDMEEDKHYAYDSYGNMIVCDKEFDKIFKTKIEPLTVWLATKEALELVNNSLFTSKWEQYCQGSVSRWEMDSICFYHHEHELINTNDDKYSIIDFNTLPETPISIGKTKGKFEYDIYEIHRLAGTVIGSDKTRHTISLLTKDGVVTVKFTAGHFAHYNKQITQIVNDVKKVIEPSWFKRGTLLCVCGYRQGEVFRAKRYTNSIYSHCVQRINEIKENGDLVLQSERTRIDNE